VNFLVHQIDQQVFPILTQWQWCYSLLLIYNPFWFYLQVIYSDPFLCRGAHLQSDVPQATLGSDRPERKCNIGFQIHAQSAEYQPQQPDYFLDHEEVAWDLCKRQFSIKTGTISATLMNPKPKIAQPCHLQTSNAYHVAPIYSNGQIIDMGQAGSLPWL